MKIQEQSAVYKRSTDPMYQYNPYVEALPEPRNIEDVANLIRRHPVYSEQEREMNALERTEAVQRISNFMEPMPIHLELEQRFSRMIRNGYFARNPLQAQWLKQFRSAFPEADPRNFESAQPMVRSTAAGFAIIGTSAMGKSTAVEYILSLYPQVISHTEYQGQMFMQKQVVWLKLECPHDGSIKGLCKEFFLAIDKLLGTEFFKKFYKSRSTTDDLLPHMALLAARLGLGALVIDEIQRLSEAKSGGAALMLNFFVQLINTIGVPVVLVGTFKAMKSLPADFSWLYRNDKDWLSVHSPILSLRRKWNDNRVDWKERDKEIAHQAMSVVHAELSSVHKPKRLSLSYIGKQIQQLALLQQHLDKLPKTAEVIRQHAESIDDFQVRRVQYAVNQMHEAREVVLRWKIIRAAGLKPGYSDVVNEAIEHCLAESISL